MKKLRWARTQRWANLLFANLRILIGFAFLPAGLKKLLHQPFTEPGNSGAFHDFLHAFHATGFFYQFVGVVQLTIAGLLLTQTFATAGAAIAFPVIAAIAAFCWSTSGLPTAIVVTLMLLGTAGLLLWDLDRWRSVFVPIDSAPRAVSAQKERAPIDLRLWRTAGIAILTIYAISCVASGGVYRPRGLEPSNPHFWSLPAIALVPLVTFAIETHRRRAARLELLSKERVVTTGS